MKRFKLFRILIPLLLIPLLGLMQYYEEKLKGQMGEDLFWGIFAVLIILIVVTSFGFAAKGIFEVFSGSYTMFWGKGKLAAGILENGYSGTATLIGIGETDGGVITVNKQPVLTISLSIEIEKQEAYETSFDVLMPRAQLPQFIPGIKFPVRIDSQDKNIVVFDVHKLHEIQNPTITGSELTEEDKTTILDYGLKALASLKSVEDTGKSEHFESIVRLSYDIHIDGEEVYCIEKEMQLRERFALNLRKAVGSSYHATVHPYDKNKIIIDVMF